ncbi:MAG: Rpn family recombination-promoting nuclease/putative transposase [Azoarcus sp.]|jgi:hypothetical protein|nr:Rpn family recombination-promoting nuclease/putative transposase [Azoarcus sp.]
MPHEIPKPRNDAVFKCLMSDKRLLVSFLQSALDLPPENYAEVQIVDPHLAGERPEDKLGILDVKVTTAKGGVRHAGAKRPGHWFGGGEAENAFAGRTLAGAGDLAGGRAEQRGREEARQAIACKALAEGLLSDQ